MDTTTEQTAQLRLAADILETGHPFEALGGLWCKPLPTESNPLTWIAKGMEIRLALATPPHGRPLHNPDNLTAEQVGAGWRLLTKDEPAPDRCDWYGSHGWETSFGRVQAPTLATYRVPLSTPWPSTPPFQLPPPPPGMQWHRKDGWTAEDLPHGYRPLTLGEEIQPSSECCHVAPKSYWGTCWGFHNEPAAPKTKHETKNETVELYRFRTTRPLTFTHLGQTWTYHRPGDPMPCDGKSNIYCVGGRLVSEHPRPAAQWFWNEKGEQEIIGWRYADEPKTQVPLGPEDVPPGSVFRRDDWKPHSFRMVVALHERGVCLGSGYGDGVVERSYVDLQNASYKINRSIPLTGKWNPDAWEPCHKPG